MNPLKTKVSLVLNGNFLIYAMEAWQKKTGYGIRSDVEEALARFKKVMGHKINSKNTKAQINEIGIAILALNRMNRFTAPKAQKSC